MSPNFEALPTNAPHEDALAAARAAVIQVLTSTAEQRDQILEEAGSERAKLLTGAEAEAASLLEGARSSAALVTDQAAAEALTMRQDAEADVESVRSDARAEAERIVDQARGAAERVRGDAAAEAHRIRNQAQSDANAVRNEAIALAEEVRAALQGLHAIDATLSRLTSTPEEDVANLAAQFSAPAYRPPVIVTEAAPAAEAPEPASETLSNEDAAEFMRQLAEQLDALDRARSAGDRDDVGRVLVELGDLAEGANANDLATFARLLGPDARPDELDELIGHCYQARVTHTVTP